MDDDLKPMIMINQDPKVMEYFSSKLKPAETQQLVNSRHYVK